MEPRNDLLVDARQQQAALQRINFAINSTLDLNEVLQRIILEAVHRVTAQSASVILHDDTTDEAELLTTYGQPLAFRTLRYPLAGSLTGWVARHRRPLRVPRLTREEWPAVWHAAEQLGVSPTPVAVLLMPLWIQGRVEGSLEVAWEPSHLITDQEAQILEAVATQAAIAIANARLYQEKARALQEVKESEERFFNAFAYAAIGMALVAPDGHWLKVNRALCDLIGYAAEELLGQTFQAITHPDDLATDLEYMRQLLAGNMRSYQMEKRYLHKSGRIVWGLLSVSLVRDAHGQPSYFISQIQDITARKQAEARVRESEERYRSLFEYASDGIALLTADGIIMSVNRAYEAMTGWTSAETIGHRYSEFVTPASIVLIEERTRRVRAGERVPSIYEQEMPRPDGSIVSVEARTRFIRNQAGQPLGVFAILRDITERKRTEEELRQAKEAAEAANRAKSEFLATMSHELRTPLGVILGYTELLLEDAFGRLGEKQTDSLRRIDRNARELLDLITAVLDLSRLEAGRLPLRMRQTQVADVLQEVQAETQPLQEQARLTFGWEIEPALPVLDTDPGKLKIVLKNLIGNAVKFTPSGSITVAARRARGGVEICVTDTGIGIPPESQACIFEPFWQLEHPLASRAGGTGLGLHIVKRLLDLLGGTVTVESAVGRGTTFGVWLPEMTKGL